MTEADRPIAKGRGSQINPPNRFESTRYEFDFEQVAGDEEYLQSQRSLPTEYIPDNSKTIISENDSPDVGFRYSLNPYRGCSHGCPYCYARTTHEYLGLSAGLDFETKVFVKERAAELFRDWLARDDWEPELIVFSGVTDCYQPAERQFRLTRRCLEVALEARQPVSIITKNALVTRDLDILKEMAAFNTVSVGLSVTTLDQSLAKVMEPRTSTPTARLRALSELNDAGVPAHVMLAPIIPGLNDSEIPSILREAADAGAQSASYILLRLPLNVRPVFLEWLDRTLPSSKERVLSRIRSTRRGQLSDSQFGQRMRGVGEIAEQIKQAMQVFSKKYGLDKRPAPLETSLFRRPRRSDGQLRLF